MKRFSPLLGIMLPMSFGVILACAPSRSAPRDEAAQKDDSKISEGHKIDYPYMPDAVASFGAAVTGDWLYLCGGHIGRAHQHTAKNLAQGFWRLNLESGTEFESLPSSTPLQGLALVAHEDDVYRVGGMNAKNQPGEDEDLHSTPSVARFDPKTNAWQDLTPLPTPRSSHDAVVHNGRLYVIGGWDLRGDRGSSWHEGAYVADLSRESLRWEALPRPPFKRRALAVAANRGKIYVLGGIEPSGAVSNSVDIFDVAAGSWSEGPALPLEKGMKGFGVSSFGVGGVLYASGADGILYSLHDNADAWQSTGFQLETGRFFHRLLPHRDRRLLFVGGASSLGHLDEIESIEISSLRLKPGPTSRTSGGGKARTEAGE